tara:strand:- start:4160 stop:5824 length:1665 start_codon:yes stop_codon:yes gene_type:complete
MVKRVFGLVYKEVRGLHQAAYILAFFAFGSQLLAIVRDRLLAHSFGADTALDLYYAAFRIPDLLFVLFASVLSIYVLLPFVNRFTEERDEKAGAEVLSQMFTLFLILYVVVAGLLTFTAPMYVPRMFPGFAGDHETLITLLQILLLQPFLIGLSNLCGIVTQMSHRFILYALSPLLYNVGIIIGIIFFYPTFGLSGLAYGVVLGALGHLAIQLPYVRGSSYTFSITKEIDWSLVRRILSVSIPRALTLSTNQIVLLVLIGMASVMTVGSVSVFQFAFNLQSVPLAIIGMSYSVAAFPTLSHLFAKSDQAGFNRQLMTALRHIIFWSVPVIALVIVLRAQIVRVLLGSGAFDWSDTRLTAAMLAVFVLSLVAQAILLLLIRAFYAGGKTFIPLCVAAVSAAVSITAAFVGRELYVTNEGFREFTSGLFRLTDVPGTEVLVLGFALVIGQTVQLILMMWLSRKYFKMSYRSLGYLSFQACLAAFTGALTAYITLQFIVDGINQDTFIGISLQGVVAGAVGFAAVVWSYYTTGSSELNEIHRSFKSKLFKTDVIAPQ